MKILILSSLFPPDTGAPAPYTKELATRLCEGNAVTLLTYGYLPEMIPGVAHISVDKRRIVPIRLYLFFKALWTATKTHQLILVQNAPSVELPLLVVSLITNVRFVLIISDPLARTQSTKGLYHWIHRLAQRRSSTHHVLPEETQYTKAEYLPFTPFDTALEERREAWWKAHCNTLLS